MRGVLVLLTAGLLAMAAAPAGAAQLYTTPIGSQVAGTCPQTAPCELRRALTVAQDGDEVIVGPGTYSYTAELANNTPHLNLHGTPGLDRPRLEFSSVNGLFVGGEDNHVSDLEVRVSTDV